MKRSSLIAVLAVAATAVAVTGPAIAKTSLSKGKQLCEAAAKAQTPAPKSVRTDNDATRVSDSTLIYTLRVRTAEDAQAALTCKVDRASDAATISPAS
jgi:hypothetical protein